MQTTLNDNFHESYDELDTNHAFDSKEERKRKEITWKWPLTKQPNDQKKVQPKGRGDGCTSYILYLRLYKLYYVSL